MGRVYEKALEEILESVVCQFRQVRVGTRG